MNKINRAKKIIWSGKDEMIWENVERLRKDKGWNYTKLAQLCKTNPQHISKINQHERGIGMKMLSRLANAFEVSESILLNKKTEILSADYKILNKYTLCFDILKDILVLGTEEQKNTIINTLKKVKGGMTDNEMISRIEKMESNIEKIISAIGELKAFGNVIISKRTPASTLPLNKKRS